jgi:hypothetical protein
MYAEARFSIFIVSYSADTRPFLLYHIEPGPIRSDDLLGLNLTAL